jgi:hypothetical protein
MAFFAVASVATSAILWAGSGTRLAADGAQSDGDDIEGVVTGASGPEAGVWVIAETTDLPTRFAKIVVTDDRGRYLAPDLPKANYTIWVRGYGLVDSPKQQAEPGATIDLRAVTAPTPARCRRVLPGRVLVLTAHGPTGK